MGKVEITISAGLAKDENGNLKTVEHESSRHYIIQIYSSGEVTSERLIPADTEPAGIRKAIEGVAVYYTQIVRLAKNTIKVNLESAG